MSNKPLVTIITVTYNCSNEIERTIQSVINQDYPNLEYIIVDGVSKDDTLLKVHKYKDNISRIVSEPDKGIYDAMNKGISRASGQFINFMNAGDSFSDNHVISNLFANVQPKHKVVYGKTKYLFEDGSFEWHNTPDLDNLKRIMSRYQPYCHQSVFYNIESKEDCLYDLQYRIESDYDVACRYWNKYGIGAFHYVPISVCDYKAYDGLSSIASNLRICKKEAIFIKIRNHMNILEILKCIVKYILRR